MEPAHQEETPTAKPTATEIVPLFGEVIVARPALGGHAGPNQFDRMRAWAEAYELWLASRRAENTKRAYGKAWNDFMAHTGGETALVGGKSRRGALGGQHARARLERLHGAAAAGGN